MAGTNAKGALLITTYCPVPFEFCYQVFALFNQHVKVKRRKIKIKTKRMRKINETNGITKLISAQ